MTLRKHRPAMEETRGYMKVESHGFDYAVWKLGGAAVYLRLVQLASVVCTL
jgi:lipoate-protein ligase A